MSEQENSKKKSQYAEIGRQKSLFYFPQLDTASLNKKLKTKAIKKYILVYKTKLGWFSHRILMEITLAS